jgi:hypothetical protein
MPVKVSCKQCGKEFFIKPHLVDKRKFCSQRCMGDSYKGRKQSPKWIAKRTATFKGRKITWMDKLRLAAVGKKASYETRQKMSEMRKGENNAFYGKRHSETAKQAISKIRIEMRLGAGEKNGQYIDGRSFYPYCEKFNARRRKAVRQFFHNICICCGCHKDENLVANRAINLDVHHIDHDKDQGCNGKPFNLIPFCRTDHFKEGLNQEEFRQYINKTLREGFKWGIWSEEEYRLKVMYDE